jgi:hypothetical protein
MPDLSLACTQVTSAGWQVMRCFHGPKMKELLVMSDITTLQEKPPWVSNLRCILIVIAGFRV